MLKRLCNFKEILTRPILAKTLDFVPSARFLGPAFGEIFKTYKEGEAAAFGKMLEKIPNVLCMRNVPKARPYNLA